MKRHGRSGEAPERPLLLVFSDRAPEATGKGPGIPAQGSLALLEPTAGGCWAANGGRV